MRPFLKYWIWFYEIKKQMMREPTHATLHKH